MKLFLLKLVAIIIAVSSLHINHSSEFSFQATGDDVLSSHPLFDINPINNPANKNSGNIVFGTLNFIDSALHTKFEFENVSIHFYLPIYSLVRTKEYFLLI